SQQHDKARFLFLDRPGRREAACGNWRDRDAAPQQSLMAIRNEFVVSNAIRRDKAKNPILWAGTGTLIIVLRQVPDNCLTNGICGLNYHFWRYRIPLAFDGYPILTLPHIVAGAVTISVGATRHSIGGTQMLKPLTHIKRNARELPTVHCDG